EQLNNNNKNKTFYQKNFRKSILYMICNHFSKHPMIPVEAEWKKLSTEIIKNNTKRITNLSLWITHQKPYPLLKIKDKSSFSDLPKNVYLAVETLTPEICKLIICNRKSNYQKTSEYQTQEASKYQTQEVSEYQTQEASEYQTQEASECQTQEVSEYQTQEALEYQIEEISKRHLQEHDVSINQDLIFEKSLRK
ncbi:10728_t:CDS:2, partial [Racocetra fulgida]